jgi:hypothetical protein
MQHMRRIAAILMRIAGALHVSQLFARSAGLATSPAIVGVMYLAVGTDLLGSSRRDLWLGHSFRSREGSWG